MGKLVVSDKQFKNIRITKKASVDAFFYLVFLLKQAID
jgi:hypothetical protein